MKMKIGDGDGPNLRFSRLKMRQISCSSRIASGLLHRDKKSLFVCLLHCCVDLHVFSLEKPCTDNSAESQLLTVAEDIRTD